MSFNTWTTPRYEIDCMDCTVDTYGPGDEWAKFAFDHAREFPGHRVQLIEKKHIVIRMGTTAPTRKQSPEEGS